MRDVSAAPDFSELREFIAQWGLEAPFESLHERMTSTLEDLERFHAAVAPRLEEIVAFPNRFLLSTIPAEYRKLGYMALALCEIDALLRQWCSPVLATGCDPRRFHTRKSLYETGLPLESLRPDLEESKD